MLKIEIGLVGLVSIVAGGAGLLFPGGSPQAPTHPPTVAESADSAHEAGVHAAPGLETRRPVGVPESAELARVSGHTDGDTLRLTGGPSSTYLESNRETRVRLLEIDTPESVAPGSPIECYALRASDHLKRLAPSGSTVWVKPDRELLDPYGRTLLYMWNSSGAFVNLQMVQEGYARAVLYEPNDEYISTMERAERHAQARRLGLWGKCDSFGEPLGVAGVNSAESRGSGDKHHGIDPRFAYCTEANDAGFGNYIRGRDPEYNWYEDADDDGVVCEF